MPIFLEMENVHNNHVSETQSSSTMKLVDQRKESLVDDDIMTRRQKNRERQRRYRARKRLEEEIKKASSVKQPTETEVYFQPTNIGNYSSTRVHCNRNWKKEARSRGLEACSNSESQTQGMRSNIVVKRHIETQSYLELPADQITSETPRKVLGRRDWKADARKMKI